MNKKSLEAGFTILEVSIAVALLGVVTYFLASLFVQSGKSMAYVTQKTSSQQVQRLLGQTLATACSCQFYGQIIATTPTNIPPLGNQITAGCDTSTPPLQTGQVIIQNGVAIPSSNNLTVSDIELTNIVPTTTGATTYTGNLMVSYSGNSGPNASLALASINIPLFIQTSGGAITGCSTSSMGGGTTYGNSGGIYWKKEANGLITEWGRGTDNVTNISFPIPFTILASMSVQVTPINNPAAGRPSGASSVTVNGFLPTNPGGNDNVTWIAIGY